MENDSVRWLALGLIAVVGFICYSIGFMDAFWLLGAAAAIWIAYDAWDEYKQWRDKRNRDISRKQFRVWGNEGENKGSNNEIDTWKIP